MWNMSMGNQPLSLEWLIELRFYIPLDTKQVNLETFFPANLLAQYSRNQTQHNKNKQHENKSVSAKTEKC